MARKTYTPEFRAAAVARVKAGESIRGVARSLGVVQSTVHVWVRDDRTGHVPMTDAERVAAANAANTRRAADRASELVFLMTTGGEHHADNLARRTGLAVSSLEYVLDRIDRRDLIPRITYGDGRVPEYAERDAVESDYHTRHLIPASVARAADPYALTR